jgi:glutamate-5-semialdehyde dehydrogenase
MEIHILASEAKQASISLAAIDSQIKNNALQAIAQALQAKTAAIVAANKEDLERSEKENLGAPLLKRLKYDASKIKETIDGLTSLMMLPEPVGETISATELDKDLELFKVSCPIGVIGVIFESRPDALVQISSLCLKSSNAVILKGGSEALKTNKILAEIIAEATEKAGIPKGWIQLIETRSDVNEMLKCDEFIDLIIPRGSNEFVQYIMNNSNIPVLGHADGICHVYVDKDADLDMAVAVTTDSKCQYVAVCNAAETLLVHESVAQEFLPKVKASLDKYNVEMFGCEKTQAIIAVKPATEQDWKTEYLDYKISIKVVSSLDEAIAHINKYSSKHTETIITKDKLAVAKFMSLIDSGNVYWNASTRFCDGFRYGLGAEVGISTNKIHARGPVGLEGLLIYKWLMKGNGHIVSDYANGHKSFTHKNSNKKFSI